MFKFHKDIPISMIPLIQEEMEKMEDKLLPVVYDTPCFGILWEDESGVCPENDCVLRKNCSNIFNSQKAWELDIVASESTKIKPNKYERNEYASLGRSVDELIRIFVHTLGYPKELPKRWSYHKLARGEYKERVLMSKMASYHSLIVDQEMVCRFWTNAASYAIVDVSSKLATLLIEKKYNISKIPEKSLIKSKPCQYRIYCLSEDDAALIANYIKELYKF